MLHSQKISIQWVCAFVSSRSRKQESYHDSYYSEAFRFLMMCGKDMGLNFTNLRLIFDLRDLGFILSKNFPCGHEIILRHMKSLGAKVTHCFKI